MKKITIDAIESVPGPAAVEKKLTKPLGASQLAFTYYELDQGESSAFGYHAHEKQEEVFYVQRGTVIFRTESGTTTATAGEVVQIPPGEFQQAVNKAAEQVVMLIVGAPQEAGELTLRRFCEACDEETPQDIQDIEPGRVRETVCSDCRHVTGRFTP
jgi:quercetin dioxygenase-like cupin family protein